MPVVEAGHLHPVRQLRDGVSARGDPRALLRRVGARRRRRKGSRRRRSPGAASPTCGSRCRWPSKTARAASCASRPARPAASKPPASRAINMEPRRRSLERERRNLAFFDDAARQPTGGRGRVARARHAVPDAAVRVSRARAPAAARRPTCGCSRSCSAIGCSSRTRRAARPSTAATCRRRRGRSTRRGGARRGRTRCSRTTPSSASATGWRSTSTASRPRSC